MQEEGKQGQTLISFSELGKRNICMSIWHLKMLLGILKVCATGLPWKVEAVSVILGI